MYTMPCSFEFWITA